jgi:hypothetical protein
MVNGLRTTAVDVIVSQAQDRPIPMAPPCFERVYSSTNQIHNTPRASDIDDPEFQRISDKRQAVNSPNRPRKMLTHSLTQTHNVHSCSLKRNLYHIYVRSSDSWSMLADAMNQSLNHSSRISIFTTMVTEIYLVLILVPAASCLTLPASDFGPTCTEFTLSGTATALNTNITVNGDLNNASYFAQFAGVDSGLLSGGSSYVNVT